MSSVQLFKQIQKGGPLHTELLSLSARLPNSGYSKYFSRWTGERFEAFHKPCNAANKTEEAQMAFSKEMLEAKAMLTRQISIGESFDSALQHDR
eukprot:GHVP01000648.1.p1 GENE.GHVP01000648.1~~GHVP01000648.1.p1  ORF type:complete len:103 (+),score=13.92 GHVP01000648.1:30-311(+)